MNSWPAAVLLVLSLGACAAPALADDKGDSWISDYARARATARASGKPIFLVFRCER
jgi:hypothetical protein